MSYYNHSSGTNRILICSKLILKIFSA